MFVSAFQNKFDDLKVIKDDIDITHIKFNADTDFKIISKELQFMLLYETHYNGVYYQAVTFIPFDNISFSDCLIFIDKVSKHYE